MSKMKQSFETYLKSNYSKLNLHTTKLDYLPSVNLVYALNTKKNIRFSYSKTLNRPEFRELAPFALATARMAFGFPN